MGPEGVAFPTPQTPAFLNEDDGADIAAAVAALPPDDDDEDALAE